MGLPLRILSAGALVLSLAGCQDAQPDRPRTEGGWTFFQAGEQDSLLRDSDHFLVDSAWVAGDSLILELQFGGGCRDHVFQPYCSAYVLESNPPQVDIHIHHLGGQDPCKALLFRRLAFDLSPLKDRVAPAFILRIHGHDRNSVLLLPYPDKRKP